MESSRRLAVIMFTDIVGYTSRMSKDENAALKLLEENRRLHHLCLEEHQGRLLKEMGDGLLLSFSSSSDALKCGGQLTTLAKTKGYDLRIGIHLGEVLFQNGDVFGDGVNIAARVEGMAVPGSVLFTEKVYDDIRNKPELPTAYLGTFNLKNVDKSTRIYALTLPGLSVPGFQAGEKKPFQTTPSRSMRRKGTLFVWLGMAAVVIFLGLVFWPGGLDGTQTSPSEDSTISIAAIPFSNVSGESESDFLGFALVDQVISSLSYLRNIVVRPSSSIRKYANQVLDPVSVSNELDVQYLLMGHYVQNQDSLRLNLELIDSRQNQVLWRESIEEKMEDAFRMQNKVAARVIDGFKIQLSAEEKSRMTKDIPKDPLAYEYYLRAVAYSQSLEDCKLAAAMLQRSLELDSTFAPAYDEYGHRLYILARYSLGENQDQLITESLAAKRSALRHNPEHLGALRNLSFTLTEMDDKDQALELAKRMVQINPSIADGHFALSYVYRYTGMMDEAIKTMETGLKIASKNRYRQFRSAGVTYNLAGLFDKAVASLQFDDGSGFAEGWKGVTYIRLQDTTNAVRELDIAARKDPGGAFEIWTKSMHAALTGSGAEWIDWVRDVQATITDSEALYSWSMNSIMLGDYDHALKEIDRAVDMGYYPYSFFLIDPILDPVREDPRFNNILEKARLKHKAFKEKHLPD